MITSSDNLNRLRVGYNVLMRRGADRRGEPMSQRIATTVKSTTREQRYGWLGKMPRIREWIGDRVVQNISEFDYSIKEKKFELTVAVDRDDIETDNLGQYDLLFEGIGQASVNDVEQLIWNTLRAGFTSNCYDGQFFFDTDHPVLDENGVPQSVANTDGGAGTPWFLLDVNGVVKPIIKQVRRDFGDVVAKNQPTDDNVFDRNEYVYAIDARMNFGYGFWQMAWGSRQILSPATFELGLTSMQSLRGDYGRPLGLGVMPLLCVPPTLQKAARQIVKSELVNGGETNPWAGTAEVLVVPWLA